MPEYIQPEKHKPSWTKKYFCPWIGQKYFWLKKGQILFWLGRDKIFHGQKFHSLFRTYVDKCQDG